MISFSDPNLNPNAVMALLTRVSGQIHTDASADAHKSFSML